MTREGRWPLRRVPESAAVARAAARAFVGPSVSAADADTVVLVVGELVANAVQHGAEPMELRLARSPGCVHIEVQDAGPSAALMGAPRLGARSGRGLVIVDRLGRWGSRLVAGGGKTVWCDVDTAAAVPDGASARPDRR